MTFKKHITRFLNSIFILMLLFFVLAVFTPFEIKNQILKWVVYIGIILVSPIVFIWNIWCFKYLKRKIGSIILPIITLAGIATIGPIKIVFLSGSWETNRVLYQNKYYSFKKIEEQIQDVGALGYNKRTVKVTYFTNWFMIITPVKKEDKKLVEFNKMNE